MAYRPSRVVETRSARYRVAWIPLPHCPIPGWSACLVQAVDADRPRSPAIRLTLYERTRPRHAGDGPRAA
jgi:hypothetical protein